MKKNKKKNLPDESKGWDPDDPRRQVREAGLWAKIRAPLLAFLIGLGSGFSANYLFWLLIAQCGS